MDQTSNVPTTQHIRFTDLAPVAALQLHGMEWSHVERPEGRTVFFFPATDEAKSVVEGFFAGTLLVEPRAFNDALRSLKVFVHSFPVAGGGR